MVASSVAEAVSYSDLAALCRLLEKESGGRLGVSVLDSRVSHSFAYRADERFAMCSVFKWLLAAAILARVDAGQENLDRRLRIRRADLLDYSPVTARFVGGPAMTVGQLCEAAIADSDNTASNLLLAPLKGPPGLNSFLRQLGDSVTRLDRREPALNEARPGDQRDTSTPAAMAENLQRLLLGEALSISSRETLKTWMLATRTSAARLRAGMGEGWRLADKTGTGGFGTANDVGIYWTPAGQPVVVCVFLTQARLDRDGQSRIIARIGQNIRQG